MRCLVKILFFWIYLLHTTMAGAGEIRIAAVHDEAVNGVLKVTLFSSEEEFLRKPLAVCASDVIDGTGNCQFDDIVDGEYAVSAYLDINGNDKLDTGLFGVPEEPIGASNDAPARFGPPSYDDARFDLVEEGIELLIHLSCPMGCIGPEDEHD
jgi:uncharacterized protein (DUF2141 family)